MSARRKIYINNFNKSKPLFNPVALLINRGINTTATSEINTPKIDIATLLI